MVSIIIDSGAKLFVSAVGVPPRAVVDRLHKHGILYMNMIGHPKHVPKCLAAGADLICAQGGEGGGQYVFPILRHNVSYFAPFTRKKVPMDIFISYVYYDWGS